jgi:uncharacterized UPF0160 family protein
MLRLLPTYSNATLLRSRNPEALETCDIIVDVTGQYDGTKHFDHHQREFTTTFSPAFSTKLSSAGLVYKHFAKAIIAQRTGLEESHPSVELLYTKIYREFIEALDANDNGISAYPADVKPTFNDKSITLPGMVAACNPAWNTPVDQAGEDALFEKASGLIGDCFLRQLDYYAKAWLPARDLVVEAVNKRSEYDLQGRILVLNTPMPWKDHLFTIEEDQEIKGENQVIYVLYSEGEGKPGWRIQCVPVSKESFISRKPLPEAWRGQRDDDLSKVSGIPGGVFVHASGFIGGNKSYEGARAMAKAALEMP